MIARGVRDLATALVCLAAATAAASALVGAVAGIAAQRAVSGGLVLVGALVFAAGAIAGLRDPSRPLTRGRHTSSAQPRDWGEALRLSAVLVGVGLCLVVAGIALDPRTSL